jgi:hypothetical protein
MLSNLKTLSNQVSNLWITVYNHPMDIATLYIYWVYGMIGISGLAILWGIIEIFRG